MTELSEQQRRLVQENLGLIRVHLRRFVSDLPAYRRHREWADVFQEGCLGLIRAAATFDPANGIPFAAFALPRIHQAVSRALEEKFTMIARPESARRRRRKARALKEMDPFERPVVRSLDASSPAHYALTSRQNPSAPPAGETVGDRLRDKYERALRLAARDIQSARPAKRAGRPELIHRLLEERLLVPQTESRKPLRRIARETGSSYARVAEYERRMVNAVRETLSSDPEFLELQRRARHDPTGVLRTLDEEVEGALAKASAAEFVRRFESANPTERTAMIHRLLDASPSGVREVLHDQIATLRADLREELLRLSPPQTTTVGS